MAGVFGCYVDFERIIKHKHEVSEYLQDDISILERKALKAYSRSTHLYLANTVCDRRTAKRTSIGYRTLNSETYHTTGLRIMRKRNDSRNDNVSSYPIEQHYIISTTTKRRTSHHQMIQFRFVCKQASLPLHFEILCYHYQFLRCL
jgi:hypothetical protein